MLVISFSTDGKDHLKLSFVFKRNKFQLDLIKEIRMKYRGKDFNSFSLERQ